MIDPFANQAPEFEIVDDAYIRWFMTENKLLGCFDAGPFSKPTTQYHRFFSHPTHWLVIGRFDGHSVLSENGYLIHCFSKTHYSREDLDSFYDFLKTNSGGGILFNPKPERN